MDEHYSRGSHVGIEVDSEGQGYQAGYAFQQNPSRRQQEHYSQQQQQQEAQFDHYNQASHSPPQHQFTYQAQEFQIAGGRITPQQQHVFGQIDYGHSGVDNISSPKSQIDTHIETNSLDSDRNKIRHSHNPSAFLTSAPKEQFRLGYLDVMALVVNSMIGTGIFNSPQRVMRDTRSTGVSLLIWLAGIIYCLAGAHVYIEYGLNVPRYIISGVEQSVPRSGGDLNYIQYVYRKPAYRKNTFMLATCMYGFGFIAFGNMASNCISFASRVLMASAVENPKNATVRGIAIGVAIATSFIHAVSRRGGIFLNNSLALIKIAILLLILGTAVAVAIGFKDAKDAFSDNVNPKYAFANASHDFNSYSDAFLTVIFSVSGFGQPTYVLAEIGNPRRRFPVSMICSIATVLILYMAVNVAYMVVVPAQLQITGEAGVAQLFFELSLGRISPNSDVGQRIFNAFLAISSLGNITVMTYTAARVKQEIAKEGILPWAKFFAQNTDISAGRMLRLFQDRGKLGWLFRMKWFRPEQHSERTPVGAFVLHFAACLVLILSTWRMTPDATYNLLSDVWAYTVNCVFGLFLGLGILILRFKGPPETLQQDEVNTLPQSEGTPQQTSKTWSQMTGSSINPMLSVICAIVFIVGNLFPVIVSWVKPTLNVSTGVIWYLIPTLSWTVLAFAIVWFVGFIAWSHTSKRKHEVFVVEKKPEFEADSGKGGFLLVHETVFLRWVARETVNDREATSGMDEPEFSGTQETLWRRKPYGTEPAGSNMDGHMNSGVRSY